MDLVVAKRNVLFGRYGTLAMFETVPVPARQQDRLTVQPIVDYFNGPGSGNQFTFLVRVSQDGRAWYHPPGFERTYSSGIDLTMGSLEPLTDSVNAAFIRILFHWSIVTAGVGAIGFECLARLDRGTT